MHYKAKYKYIPESVGHMRKIKLIQEKEYGQTVFTREAENQQNENLVENPLY